MGAARAGRVEAIAEALRWACALDVEAPKPGNVSRASPSHGMRAADFIASAEAAVGPLGAPGLKVGERIAEAVAATWDHVGMNTNLGIVLLAAPLTQAALTAEPDEGLRDATQRVLGELDASDAAAAFRAIVRANPAGLGQTERLDVRSATQATLLDAMREAAHRDAIALQYATGFRDVFEFGVPRFVAMRQRFADDAWAVVACYLGWLTRFPDTHIARKHGLDAAHQVNREAIVPEAELMTCRDPSALIPKLAAWDVSLKERALNPGTSADLTVASVLAARLAALLEERFLERDGATSRFATERGCQWPD